MSYRHIKGAETHFVVEEIIVALKQKDMYSMHQHVYDYIQTWTKCQRIKNQKHGHNGPSPLTSMSIDDPFDR